MIIDMDTEYGVRLYVYYDSNKDEVAFTYNSSQSVDFVISCLNEDYIEFFERTYPLVYKKSDTAARKYEESLNRISSPIPYYQKNMALIREDLSHLDLNMYKELVEKLYDDEKYQNLSAAHKYFAFMASHGLHQKYDGSMRNKYPGFASIKPIENFSARYYTENGDGPIYDKIDQIYADQNKDSANAVYEAICELDSDGNFSFIKFREYTSLREVFEVLFHKMIEDNLIVKRCKHCGRYFKAQRITSKYCYGESPTDPNRTCIEYVRYQNYLSYSHMETAKLHKQIYNNLVNKWKRSKNKIPEGDKQLRLEIDCFLRASEIYRTRVEEGMEYDLTYIKWLKDIKEGKIDILEYQHLLNNKEV
jgi:hypothetical protein